MHLCSHQHHHDIITVFPRYSCRSCIVFFWYYNGELITVLTKDLILLLKVVCTFQKINFWWETVNLHRVFPLFFQYVSRTPTHFHLSWHAGLKMAFIYKEMAPLNFMGLSFFEWCSSAVKNPCHQFQESKLQLGICSICSKGTLDLKGVNSSWN